MSQFDPAKQHKSGLERFILRVFPERQFHLRKGDDVQWVRISTARQVMAAGLVAVILGWTGFASVQIVLQQSVIGVKDRHIDNARAAYATLVEQMAEYKLRVGEATAELERNHAESLALLNERKGAEAELARLERDKNKKKTADARAEMDNQLAELANEAERLERQRRILKQQLAETVSRMDRDVAQLSERTKAPVDGAGSDIGLAKVVLQRDLAIRQRDDLAARADSLVEQLAEIQNTQMLVFERFAELTDTSIAEIEKMLSVTGLDVNMLLDRSRQQVAQGGPFVPADKGDLGDDKLNAKLAMLNDRIDRWGGLQLLQKTLPLGPPMKHYQLTSHFGNRRDPFNGKLAKHEGVDLGAPIKTKIYAVAPGKVLFAGWKARYGKVVIVDHGMGFSTLYGHMYAVDVEKGQTVDTTTVLGRVGNTGRSTGPHLHYEVRINEQPRNPAKFIKAGRNVFKD